MIAKVFAAWLAAGSIASAWPSALEAIPYFARRYGVSCQQCHAAVPKLNSYGERFVAQGYYSADLPVARGTWPFALWLSGRSDALPGAQQDNEYKAYPNRVELISGGRFTNWLSYFIEWRALSLEARADGSLRDRSGRFEDLFVVLTRGPLELTLGQFRQIAQVDVSRRLGISEPLVLSSGLPAFGTGSPREVSLRAFSPAGRSPAVRLGVVRPLRAGWRWTNSLGVPVPGELSIPLSDEARNEASNEIEWRTKGVVIESFLRRGLTSVGAHLLYDSAERYLAQLLWTGTLQQRWHWTLAAGGAHVAEVTRGRWSAEGEFIPMSAFAVGTRAEDRAGDGAPIAVLPFVSIHFPGTRYTVRLTLERRFQEDRNATFLELGAVF